MTTSIYYIIDHSYIYAIKLNQQHSLDLCYLSKKSNFWNTRLSSSVIVIFVCISSYYHVSLSLLNGRSDQAGKFVIMEILEKDVLLMVQFCLCFPGYFRLIFFFFFFFSPLYTLQLVLIALLLILQHKTWNYLKHFKGAENIVLISGLVTASG